MSDKGKQVQETFIIDCPYCRAKVAAIEEGRVFRSGWYGEPDGGPGEPFATLVQVGHCPKCKILLVGESEQIDFADHDAEYDRWSDVVRVHPKPPKVFTSSRIPKVVKNSLAQAEGALQGNAPDAACVMLGRALEAICRHLLEMHKDPEPEGSNEAKPDADKAKKAQAKEGEKEGEGPKKKQVMLDAGLKKLKEKGLIDPRLYEWSQHLKAFRNFSAHPDEDFSASREDVEDFQSFVYAFTEYTYDLADRYEDFLDRQSFKQRRMAKKK
jgi:hypothetical protein